MSIMTICYLILAAFFGYLTSNAAINNENKFRSVIWATFTIISYMTFLASYIIDKINI